MPRTVQQLRNSGKRLRRNFSDEFKRDAVEIVTSIGNPIAQVLREPGIYDSTWENWFKHEEINRGVRRGVAKAEQEGIVCCDARTPCYGLSVNSTLAWSKLELRRASDDYTGLRS